MHSSGKWLSLILFGPGNTDVHILQPLYQFSPIEEVILDLHYPLLICILRSILSTAETSRGPGNGPRHAMSLPPSGEVCRDVRRELKSVEVPTDQSIRIELLNSRKEVAVECESCAVAEHAE